MQIGISWDYSCILIFQTVLKDKSDIVDGGGLYLYVADGFPLSFQFSEGVGSLWVVL
jgi:hypothetical protein